MKKITDILATCAAMLRHQGRTPKASRRVVMRALPVAAIIAAAGCTIEPPLHLASNAVEIRWPEVRIDINAVWDLDADWDSMWWYGWDETDINLWGPIAYPEPTSHQVRVYFYGEDPTQIKHIGFEAIATETNKLRRRFEYGYHDLLIWSDIHTSDGSQVVRFDETDVTSITATTTPSRSLITSGEPVKNNPEVFYAGLEEKMHVTRDTSDYTYDPVADVWYREVQTEIYPLVYIYVVQVVIYNNNGKITGTADLSGINSLSESVKLHTGHTSNDNITVTFPQRMKRQLPARNGRLADILGGKLTTFGLCDMESWARSRAPHYAGSRDDLRNYLHVNFLFSNAADSTYRFEVTDQMQRQAHGGVITIEIDADTIRPPSSGPSGAGSGFDPQIDDWHDSIPPDIIM